jgi:hypothetical protein
VGVAVVSVRPGIKFENKNMRKSPSVSGRSWSHHGLACVTVTRHETENVGREISNEGFPAYAVVPAQHGGNNQSREDRQALNLLRQYERGGYGVIATMTVQFENHHLSGFD